MDWVQPLLEVEQICHVILLDNAGSQLVQTQVKELWRSLTSDRPRPRRFSKPPRSSCDEKVTLNISEVSPEIYLSLKVEHCVAKERF
jgi:hypothetical protein